MLGAIRDLNRLELAGETVRAALETLAAAAPGWLAGVIDASWQEVYGQRIDEWRLPASQARRTELASWYGRDGYHLLEAAFAPGAPGWLRELPAVEALRRVWVQQFTRGQDGTVTRREAGLESGLPPGRSRITSPYDLDARYSQKRGKEWRGCKVHLTETCTHPAERAGDPRPGAALNLITNVATTMAAVPDAAMTGPVHDMLAAAGLTPAEHAADAGYAGADLLLDARARGITLLAPLAARPPRRPGPAATPRTCSLSTGTPSRSPAPRERPAAPGPPPAPAAATGSPWRFPPPPAGPARPAASAPPRPARAGSCSCAPATSTRLSPPSAASKSRRNGRTVMPSGQHRRHHPAGHRRHRHPHRPLQRAAQDQPRDAAAATAINLIRLDAWWISEPLSRTRTTCLQRLNLPTAA